MFAVDSEWYKACRKGRLFAGFPSYRTLNWFTSTGLSSTGIVDSVLGVVRRNETWKRVYHVRARVLAVDAARASERARARVR